MATITSIAGTGVQGFNEDDVPASQAIMDNPFHVDLDPSQKNLYFADCFNYRVRKVELATGEIKTIAGTGKAGHSGDGGPATQADIDEVYAIQVDTNGDIYIVQRFNPSIRKIDAESGIITTVAGDTTIGYGGDGGPAVSAQFREPNDCALDGKGGLLIADVQDQRIRRLDLNTGMISTFGGTGEKAHTGDGGPADKAGIFGARAVCVDGHGNAYVCEREGNCIRKIDVNGIITRIAGTGEKGYTGDGAAAFDAMLNGPKAIRCDANGNVFIVDTENHAIRVIDVSTGVIATVAGGHRGPDGDGGDPLKAGLARPHGVVIDDAGAFYIADSENHRIRMVQR